MTEERDIPIELFDWDKGPTQKQRQKLISLCTDFEKLQNGQLNPNHKERLSYELIDSWEMIENIASHFGVDLQKGYFEDDDASLDGIVFEYDIDAVLTRLSKANAPDDYMQDEYERHKNMMRNRQKLILTILTLLLKITMGGSDIDKVPLDDKELTILIELADNQDKTFSQVKIGAFTNMPQGTIKDKLLRLESIGLVHRPLGERKGYQITPKGRQIAQRNQ